MRYAIPHLRAAGGGAIVNFSSVLAELTLPNCSGYTAAKAAVIGLTKATALEVGRDGIRVNCILPGSVDTAMMWEGLSDAERREFEPRADAAQPLGKVGQPEEIARVTLSSRFRRRQLHDRRAGPRRRRAADLDRQRQVIPVLRVVDLN